MPAQIHPGAKACRFHATPRLRYTLKFARPRLEASGRNRSKHEPNRCHSSRRRYGNAHGRGNAQAVFGAGWNADRDPESAAQREVANDTEIVLVHDAVRPFVTPEQIARVIEEARRCEAAILGIPAMDTVKEVKRASLPEDVALIMGTMPRERVVLAQTPQAFSTKLLKDAFARAEADGVNASDEAGLVECMGHDVHVVLGSERNMKITKPADMELARFYVERERQKV